MIGFPVHYGDSLDDEKARKNLAEFVNKYGIIMVLLVFTPDGAMAFPKGKGKAPAPSKKPVAVPVPPTTITRQTAFIVRFWAITLCAFLAVSYENSTLRSVLASLIILFLK